MGVTNARVHIGEVIKETAEGFLSFITNELRIYAKNNDAPKLRLGGRRGQSLGVLSINVLDYDDDPHSTTQGELLRETENALVSFKQDESKRSNLANNTAELTIHLLVDNPAVPDDRKMVPVLLIRPDGWTPLVPFKAFKDVVHGPSLQPDSPTPPADLGAPRVTRFSSDNGRFVFNVQGDENPPHIVVYDTWDANGQPVDEAVWSQHPIADWQLPSLAAT